MQEHMQIQICIKHIRVDRRTGGNYGITALDSKEIKPVSPKGNQL